MALQLSSGSQREKWIAAFLPTVAVLLIGLLYVTFITFPDLKQAESEFNQALSKAVSPTVVAQLQSETASLRNQQAEMQSEIRAVDDEVAANSEAFQKLSPTAKHSAVTALCREHGVAILRDQEVNEIALSTLRKESIETLRSLVPSEAINFRELTLAADYVSVVTVLKKLPEVSGVIPVAVKLEKTSLGAPGESQRPFISWTIGLLM